MCAYDYTQGSECVHTHHWFSLGSGIMGEVFYVLFLNTMFSIMTKCCFCCCCSVAKSCLTLCDPMDCSTPGFSVLHHVPKFVQIDVHWVGDAIPPSHLLLLPSPLAFSLPQHQGLFQWVGSSQQVAKVLELQLQH